MFGSTIAAIVALFLALPVAAGQPAAPPASNASQGGLPTTLTYDSGWKAGGSGNASRIEPDRDVEMWSLALIGPAAMIFIVTALGLTITVRSLRDDVRRRRSLDHDWRHGAMSRAGRLVRACPQASRDAEDSSHEAFPSA
jgi:hypothetical protein